jgi:Rieske Fe-S protein
MRSAIWVLRSDTDAAQAASLVAALSDRGLQAHVTSHDEILHVVIDEPPDDLTPPPEVLRTARVDVPPEFRATRRTFLDSFATALAAVVAGSAVGVAGLFANPPARRGDGVDELDVTSMADLRERGFATFRFGSEPGIVVLASDRLHALSLVCTHLGCLVEWSAARRQLLCPCHRAAFDLGGNVLEGPAPRPLRAFDVSIQGDRVLVRRPGGARA